MVDWLQCHEYELAMFLPISFVKILSFDTSKKIEIDWLSCWFIYFCVGLMDNRKSIEGIIFAQRLIGFEKWDQTKSSNGWMVNGSSMSYYLLESLKPICNDGNRLFDGNRLLVTT